MRFPLPACLILCMALAACGGPRPRPAPLPPRAEANDIVFRAMALVGTPYRSGGNTPATGFDCSGLVDYVFRDVAAIALPRTAAEMAASAAPRIDHDALQSGDLVFFHGRGRRVTHVGIYVGAGRFVHAPNKGGTVRLDALDGAYWRAHYSGATRVLPLSATAAN